MLTPKMKKIADDIGNDILNNYNRDYLDTLFSCGIGIEDVIFQVLVLCCRYAFLSNAEKHPLSYYYERENLEPDLARKEYERTLKNINEKFDLLGDATKNAIGYEIPRPDITLVKKENNRYPSYSFSEFQYWEIQNVHDMRLVKAIVENRISSSHKISNKKFIEMANQYDQFVKEELALFGTNSYNTVLSSIKLFTLQTKYSFDFVYELAVAMDNFGVKDIPDMQNRLITLASSYKCSSILPDICPDVASDLDRWINYPMILQRSKLVEKLVTEKKGSAVDVSLSVIIEANVLSNAVKSHMHIGGIRLPTLVAQETDMEDWASVFEIYNVFRTHVPNKEWNEGRIQAVRKMYSLISLDYKKL